MDQSLYGTSLQRAQGAPQFLKTNASSSTTLTTYIQPAGESLEQWQACEQLVTACLRTGDDKSAHMCLEHLVTRFGSSNERVMALRGLYKEAVADTPQSLEEVLCEYDEILTKSPANIPIAKRRVALLKSLSRFSDAAKALVAILDISQTDAEAWAELSDLYVSLGLYAQAIYCLEEVLLVTPNAWNLHARLGEVLYMSSMSDSIATAGESPRVLCASIKRFCRSIELCSDYLRSYCGLKLATDRFLSTVKNDISRDDKSITVSVVDAKELNERAAYKISSILESKCDEKVSPDIAAARLLLDQGLPFVQA